MTILRIQALVMILIIIVANGCARSPQARRDKYLAQGRALVEKKEYSRAILAFKNAAKAMPNDAEPYYQLGLAALQAGDIRAGLISIKRATELNPKRADAQLKLAELMAQGDAALIRQAESRLLELRETAPVTGEMLNALAYTELRLGKPTDAVQALEEFFVQHPGELGSAILLARAKLVTEDVKGAEEVLQKASAASPQAAEPHVVLGVFYRNTKRPREAETHLQTALTLDPHNSRALYILADVQYGAGRIQDAEATFQRLAALSEAPYKPIYALFLLRQGRNDEAVREFERLTKKDPNDRMTRTQLVSAYQLVGRKADAAKVIQEAVRKNPKDMDALMQQAQLSVTDGKYEDAEKDLNKVLQLQPDLASVHYFLGKLHQGRGQELSGRQEFSKAVQLDALLLSARLALAQSLIKGKDPKGAVDILDAAPGRQRSLPQVIVQRNWALWAEGDMAQMRKGIDTGLAEQRTTDLLLQDGLWKLRSGNAAAARASLEEALKIDPRDGRALSALAESYETQKQTAEALQKVKEYAAREPKSAPVQGFLGALLLTRGDHAGARAAFEAAKAADPHSVQVNLSLIQVDLSDGKLDDAQRKLQAMLSTDSTNPLAHLWMGNLKAMKRDYKGAEEQYRAVVAADPNNPEALNNLAYLLADQRNEPAEALKYAQKAKELAPNASAYADTLGWVYYHQGLYALAIQELERATASHASAASEYHLAMAYAKAGDRTRGLQALTAALKQDPQLPEARLAQQLLTEAPSNGGNPR
jgi:tetratricopeptide (TPR) repeat protein